MPRYGIWSAFLRIMFAHRSIHFQTCKCKNFTVPHAKRNSQYSDLKEWSFFKDIHRLMIWCSRCSFYEARSPATFNSANAMLGYIYPDARLRNLPLVVLLGTSLYNFMYPARFAPRIIVAAVAVVLADYITPRLAQLCLANNTPQCLIIASGLISTGLVVIVATIVMENFRENGQGAWEAKLHHFLVLGWICYKPDYHHSL